METIARGAGALTDYFEAESALRRGSYQREVDVERALNEMNEALSWHSPLEAGEQAHPTVLVFGLPRSGTTLLYQTLCWSLDVGYPNNIIARFWAAPRFGVVLTRALLGDERDGSFLSDYGRTSAPAGPHEFRYFWQRWLGLEGLDAHLDFGDHEQQPDWTGLRAGVGELQEAFDRPLVFKSLYLGQFVPGLLAAFDKPLLVYVDRSPDDVALSILAARRSYYDRTDVWWSTMPPDYLRIAQLPVDRQIARQVADLRHIYEDKLARVDPGVWLRVSYEELCASPSTVVDAVREALRRRYGSSPAYVNPLPEAFPVQRARAADAGGEAVLRALHEATGR